MPFGDFVLFISVYMDLQESYMPTVKYSNTEDTCDAE